MKIFNVRFGFATNSSSAHSIVVLNDSLISSGVDVGDGEFGWEYFILSNEENKRQYFGQVVKYNMMCLYNLSTNDAAIIASDWAGTKVNPDGYIDHQSQIILPVEYEYHNEKHIIRKYAEQFLEYLLQDNVVICGGNDNDDNRDQRLNCLPIKNIFNQYISYGKTGDVVGRYDESGKFWTLFNKSNGTKIRMSFYQDSVADNSDKPELVDVKITSYCDKGCSFCYQSSTKTGAAADVNFISNVADKLNKLGVFEVALGGGEPTTHPDFLRILQIFVGKNIITNFSTRNPSWLVKNMDSINNLVGAIGISVQSSKEIKSILQMFDRAKIIINKNYSFCIKPKITFQVVVGCCSDVELKNILKESGKHSIPVLLLGWKIVGFGSTGPMYDFKLSDVLDQFKEKKSYGIYWNGPSISFDSALVEKEKEWLSNSSNKEYWTLGEGTHSMYIDCVEKKMGKSSFGTEFTALNKELDNIELFFQRGRK